MGETGDVSSGAFAFRLYRLGRKIAHHPALGALIPSGLRAGVNRRLMARAIDRLPDRRYMEEVLLPALASLKPRRLLDVGVQPYTRHHVGRLPADCEYWTMEIDPGMAAFGSPGRHIVGDALDLGSHFEPASLDIIINNGTFGFGIDRPDDQERMIAAARLALRPGGWLLVGWDRSPDGSPFVMKGKAPGEAGIKDPLELEGIRSGFDHEAPDGLPARVDFADCSHVYDWFRAR